MKRYCQTLTLVDNPELIEKYVEAHSHVWPEVIAGQQQVGILSMEIYRHGRSLFMIMDTVDEFDFERDMARLAGLPRQAEWEAYVAQFQGASASASSQEKWKLTEKIFDAKAPAVSVILVAYNAKGTIGRCIDSILAQSFQDFELVAVDDGSTDGTADILNGYASLYGNMHVLSQTNSGVAAARQKGLDNASGEYTIFVDADDWIEPDMLEKLLDKAREDNADMVMADMLEDHPWGTERTVQRPASLRPEIVMAQMLGELHGSLCNKLIRRSCYTHNNLRFLPGVNCCEDQYMVVKLLSYGIKVSYLDAAFYHYVKNGNGSSLTGQWMKFPLAQRVLLLNEFKDLSTDSYYQNRFNRYAALVAYDAIFAPKGERKHFRRHFWPFRKQIRQANVPFHKKFLVEAYLHGIPLPVQKIKEARSSR